MRSLACANCGAELPPSCEREPDVLVCAACGSTHRAASQPEGPPDPTAEFRVGDAVLVLWGQHWWPARVRRVVAEDIWQVTYDGWSDDLSEIVDVARVRARSARARPVSPRLFAGLVVTTTALGVAVAVWALGIPPLSADSAPVDMSARGPITPTGAPLPAGLRVPPGTELEVQWNDSFYRAVSQVHFGDGSIRVHYTGWSDALDGEVDEADVRISEAAIRASRGPVEGRGPLVGPNSPLFEGDVLEVSWREGYYRAVVLRTLPDGRLRVHYAGWEDDFDEDIPRERARRVLAAEE